MQCDAEGFLYVVGCSHSFNTVYWQTLGGLSTIKMFACLLHDRRKRRGSVEEGACVYTISSRDVHMTNRGCRYRIASMHFSAWFGAAMCLKPSVEYRAIEGGVLDDVLFWRSSERTLGRSREG